MPAALQTRPAEERRSTRSNSPGSGPGACDRVSPYLLRQRNISTIATVLPEHVVSVRKAFVPVFLRVATMWRLLCLVMLMMLVMLLPVMQWYLVS